MVHYVAYRRRCNQLYIVQLDTSSNCLVVTCSISCCKITEDLTKCQMHQEHLPLNYKSQLFVNVRENCVFGVYVNLNKHLNIKRCVVNR